MRDFPGRSQLFLLLIITFITRIFFIFDGYGVEEDSWGLVVNAFEMKQTGHYVASRVPGHPLQEYVYRLVYNAPAWVYNSFSLIASLFAVGYFYMALRKMQFSGAFAAAVMLCFTPAFYISGTYTIDFAWSMAFVMASFYYLLHGKFVLSGILLGMATGCRITSAAFMLPWALMLWSSLDTSLSIKKILRVGIPAAIVGGAWFIPAYLHYGPGFFDYSDQFPYPPFAKIAYKATLGVFGLIGMLAMLWFLVPALRNWQKKELQAVTHFTTERLLTVCLAVIAVFTLSYLRLPQKSGYMLPIVPFVILFFGLLLRERSFRYMAYAFVLSPFLFSINLTDPLRGASSSKLAVTFHAAGQEIFIDPLSGPVFSERSKRRNKMEYCSRVIETAEKMDPATLVISGWWYNEILTHYLQAGKKPPVNFRFYVECRTLDSARVNGMKNYYLPEQNLYNDQMFGQSCTDSLAKPYPEK